MSAKGISLFPILQDFHFRFCKISVSDFAALFFQTKHQKQVIRAFFHSSTATEPDSPAAPMSMGKRGQ